MEAKYIVVIVGLVALLTGIYYLNRYVVMRRWGMRAEGSIYDIITTEHASTDGQRYFERHLEIGFLTRTHQLLVKRINVNITYYKYKKGDTINVLYEEQNPDNLMIDDGASPAYMYFLCLFPGILFLMVGLGMILI